MVKSQEKKERWKEKKGAKRQKREDEESAVVPAVTAVAAAEQEVEEEEEENVQPAMDPLENGFLHHAQREQERMNERLLKKTYSKKNKTVSPHLLVSFLSLHSSIRANRLLRFCGNPPPVRSV